MQALTDDIRKAIHDQLTAVPARRSNVDARDYKFKPYYSASLGVSAQQIPEAEAHLRANGIPAEFNADGEVLVTSSRQFREIAKACGIYDGRDGYQPRNYEGKQLLSGRAAEDRKREVLRRLARGDYD